MPFIHIKSLPQRKTLNIGKILEFVSLEFSDNTGVEIAEINVTWEFLTPGYYACGGVMAFQQPEKTHPVLVDLLAPDFNSKTQIKKMMESIAESISKHTNIPKDNILINYRKAHSGMVFDAGEVVQW